MPKGSESYFLYRLLILEQFRLFMWYFYLSPALFVGIHLRRGGHVFGLVCSLFTRITEKLVPACHETWWKGAAWAKEETIKFWSGSKSLFFTSVYIRELCPGLLHVVLLTYFSPRCDAEQKNWDIKQPRCSDRTFIYGTLHRAWQASVCLSMSACVHLVSPVMTDTSAAHFLC